MMIVGMCLEGCGIDEDYALYPMDGTAIWMVIHTGVIYWAHAEGGVPMAVFKESTIYDLFLTYASCTAYTAIVS